MKPSSRNKRSSLLRHWIRRSAGYKDCGRSIKRMHWFYLDLSRRVSSVGQFTREFVWVGVGENCGYICVEG